MFRRCRGLIHGYEDDLAGDATCRNQLMGASRVRKRKPRDQRLDPVLPEELEQREQILTKQRWSQPFQPLDAVQDHALAAGKKPTTGDVQADDSDGTNTMTPPRVPRRSLSLDGGRQPIGHHRPVRAASAPSLPHLPRRGSTRAAPL